MLLNERHAMYDLLQEELRTKSAVFYPTLDKAEIRMALAAAGAGLDHTVGEQAFVLVDDSHQGKFQAFTLVTDRRVCGRWPAMTCLGVRDHQAQAVQLKKTMLDAKIPVGTGATAGPSAETIQAGSNLESLVRFLSRVVTVAPDGREPPARPLAVPTPEDPTGPKRAAAWLGADDSFAAQLLAYVDAAHESGKMPTNVAIDFVARIALHHRNLHFGRGMAEGRYLSPVSMNDLSNAMATLYGNPIGHTEQPVRTLDFDSRLRSRPIDGMKRLARTNVVSTCPHNWTCPDLVDSENSATMRERSSRWRGRRGRSRRSSSRRRYGSVRWGTAT